MREILATPRFNNLRLDINNLSATNDPVSFKFDVDSVVHWITVSGNFSVLDAVSSSNAYVGYNVSHPALLAAGVPNSGLIHQDAAGIAVGVAGPLNITRAFQINMNSFYAKANDVISARVLGTGTFGVRYTVSVAWNSADEWMNFGYKTRNFIR